MNDFIKGINDIFNNIFQMILMVLPNSPFKGISLPSELDFFMGVINYYIPFQGMVNLAFTWISCIGIYYVYQLIMRKISAIS